MVWATQISSRFLSMVTPHAYPDTHCLSGGAFSSWRLWATHVFFVQIRNALTGLMTPHVASMLSTSLRGRGKLFGPYKASSGCTFSRKSLQAPQNFTLVYKLNTQVSRWLHSPDWQQPLSWLLFYSHRFLARLPKSPMTMSL